MIFICSGEVVKFIMIMSKFGVSHILLISKANS